MSSPGTRRLVGACAALAVLVALPGRPAGQAREGAACRVRGRVLAVDGKPVAGATVAFSNGVPSQVTDELGRYEAAAPADGERCVVTPSKPGHVFVPAQRTVWLSGDEAEASFLAVGQLDKKRNRTLQAAANGPQLTSFAINSGQAVTSSRAVSLNHTVEGTPLFYMASELPTFTGAEWELYTPVPIFILSPGNDTKRVYFKVADNFWDSAVWSDTIVLNEPEVVELVVNGPVRRGKLWQAGEADWYFFTAAEAGTYRIETWPGSLGDTFLGLYEDDQATVLAEDDDSGEGACARIVEALEPGTYFVKAQASNPADTGTYYIRVMTGETLITILNPHGDPEADTQLEVGTSEVVFSSSAPGVLDILCRFVVKAGPVSGIADKVRACIEPVGNSALAWRTPGGADATWAGSAAGRPASAHATMGKATYDPATNRFEVRAVFTGLPTTNAGFGPKMLWAQVVDGATVVASAQQPIEVFFPKTATNNAGTGRNAGPNWFYFWKTGNVCGTTTGWEYADDPNYGYYVPGEDHINVGNAAPNFNSGPEYYENDLGDVIEVAGQGLGPHCTAETIAHEQLHKWIFETWDPLIAAAEADGENDGDDFDDPDDDSIPNVFEPIFLDIATDPNDPDTYNMGWPYTTYGDQELRCRKIELDHGLNVNDEDDWAYPGTNSYPPYPREAPPAEAPDLPGSPADPDDDDGDGEDQDGEEEDPGNQGDPGDNVIIQNGTGRNDTFTAFGGAGNDVIIQRGREGADTLTAYGGDDDDTLRQGGGRGADTLNNYGGAGNDTLFQRGKRGADYLAAYGGEGDDSLRQKGGRKADTMIAYGGAGNDLVWQRGGPGRDALLADGGEGDDTVWMFGCDGADSLTYEVSPGNDRAWLHGGGGKDTALINSNGQNFTVLDKRGNVLYQRGEGGTIIEARSIENLTIIGDDGATAVYTGSAP